MIDAWSIETSGANGHESVPFHITFLASVHPTRTRCFFRIGGTIADLIQDKKNCSEGSWPVLSETDSLGYLEDVLKAVEFLHGKGIVHRDIKGNVKTELSCCFTFVHRVCKHFQKELQTRSQWFWLGYLKPLTIIPRARWIKKKTIASVWRENILNEWMCISIPHTSHDVSWRFTMLLSEIERQLVRVYADIIREVNSFTRA